jgi:hypothetical protein
MAVWLNRELKAAVVSERDFDVDAGNDVAGAKPSAPTRLSGLLDDLAVFIRRFVVVSEMQAVAIALWIAHTSSRRRLHPGLAGHAHPPPARTA